MATKNMFRKDMIVDAQNAATAMQSSSIGKQLKTNGFTSASMTQEATDLTDLHQKAQAARAAWLQASAALSTKAQAFDLVWSSYCSIVRGVTPSETVRKAHGVASPGVKKGPQFRRGPRKPAATTATAPAAPVTKPQ
jgi:hypothetical protein